MSKENIRKRRKSAEKVGSTEKKKGKRPEKSKSRESVQKITSAEKANLSAEVPETSKDVEKSRPQGFLSMLKSLRIKKKKRAEKTGSDEKTPEKADAGTDSESQEKGAHRFKHMLSSIWDRSKAKAAEKGENVESAEEKQRTDSADKTSRKTSSVSTPEKTTQTISKTDTEDKEKFQSGLISSEKTARKKLEKDAQRDATERAVEVNGLKTMRLPEKSLMSKPKAEKSRSLVSSIRKNCVTTI
ncbi:unnamed protein product [Cylicostephanus goldi]|uniref:Uncharacterized protein n=1 Tax=Cylicostephanus goldi TaxID=71465 RepID=A0A3P6U1A6_CYLGO|nr:unnamed protein product [Cylicostephanus goldi]